MRVTLERSVFLKALTHVQNIVERRNTIPILANVMLQATDGQLRLTATDLDIEVVEVVPAEIGRAGAATVPAHMLHDIVRKLPDGAQLELEQGPDTGRVSIVAGRSRFALQALPPEDFPTLSAGDLPHVFSLPAADLAQLIEKTRFAISTEETRYYLNGIYLHERPGDGLLRAVSTDGHRLARADVARPAGAAGMPGVIVPRKAVLELAKLLDAHEGEVEIALSAAKIRISIDEMIITSKLIDGTFPDYERVIPRNNDKIVTFETRDFSAAVDRVSTISQEKGRAVKLAIAGGRVVFSVNSPDSGSAEEEIVCDYAQDALEIGFNARYLIDIMGQLKNASARMVLADGGSPTIFQDEGDAGTLYVLMPMRV